MVVVDSVAEKEFIRGLSVSVPRYPHCPSYSDNNGAYLHFSATLVWMLMSNPKKHCVLVGKAFRRCFLLATQPMGSSF
jgi:hypothetical protein